MFNHPLGLLWSYDSSWSSPLMHPQQQNHTICFQGSVLTTDKHSSDCGGNRFFFFLFFSKLQCVPLSAWSPSLWPRGNACEAEQLWRGPFSCRTTGGHCFNPAPHRVLFVGRHSGHRQWGRFTGIKWGCQIFATFLITCSVYFQSLGRKRNAFL